MTMSFSSAGRPVPRLPFRIVLIGEFSGNPRTTIDPRAGAGLVRVDGSNFDEVLAQRAPSLTLEMVEGPLTLRFDSFRSLRPEGLVRQIPGGQERMIVRQLLTQLKNRKVGGEEVVARIRQAAIEEGLKDRIVAALEGRGEERVSGRTSEPAGGTPGGISTVPGEGEGRRAESDRRSEEVAPGAGDAGDDAGSGDARVAPEAGDAGDDAGALGGLLGLVDLPGRPSGEPPRPTPPDKTPRPPDPAAAAISAVIGSIAGGGRAAVGGPGPAEAETALRLLDNSLGADLRRVLEHPAFRRFETAWRGLRFLIGRIDFREGITLEIADAAPEAGVDLLRALAYEKASGAHVDPISLVAGGWVVPLSAEILAGLAEAGRAAETLDAPFVVGVDPGGEDSVVGAAEWEAFRTQHSSAWLGLAVNPFLLRLNYGPETDPVRDFDFEEPEDNLVTGSPALGVTALAARSHARTGWPTHLEGREAALEDLPVHAAPGGSVPTMAALAPEEATALAAAGLIPLVAFPGRDQIFAFRAPSPSRESSLALRLAASRLTSLLARALRETRGDAEAFRNVVARQLAALGSAHLDFETRLEPAAGWPEGVQRLFVRCRPGPPILPAAREMELSFLV